MRVCVKATTTTTTTAAAAVDVLNNLGRKFVSDPKSLRRSCLLQCIYVYHALERIMTPNVNFGAHDERGTRGGR